MRRLLSTALLPAMAATAMGLEFDAFLEIREKPTGATLSGASQDKIYYGWTKISGFRHGAVNTLTDTSGGVGAGKAAFLPITFAKAVDQITPELMRGACLGTKYDHLKLVLVARSKNRTELWDVTLKGAMISEQTWTTATNSVPLEGVAINCGEMLVNFTGLSSKPPTSSAGWSVLTNATVPVPADESPLLDSDLDGIPDIYEMRYGLKTEFADSAADLDGDGVSNLLEYIANTDPTKPDSSLRAQLKPAPTAGMFQLTWQGTPGTTYRVEYCETLGTAYTPAETFYTDTAREMKAFVPAGVRNSRFYRVIVVE